MGLLLYNIWLVYSEPNYQFLGLVGKVKMPLLPQLPDLNTELSAVADRKGNGSATLYTTIHIHNVVEKPAPIPDVLRRSLVTEFKQNRFHRNLISSYLEEPPAASAYQPLMAFYVTAAQTLICWHRAKISTMHSRVECFSFLEIFEMGTWLSIGYIFRS